MKTNAPETADVRRKSRISVYLKPLSGILAFAVLAVFTAMPGTAGDSEQERELSQGQKNIVLRARQVMEIEWTPQSDIISWRDYPNFLAGETYRGIPYGRPDNAKQYVPIGTSFEAFLNSLEDPDSLMYTSNTVRDSLAPYYVSDCSAFVSWAWGLEEARKTIDLPLYADFAGTGLNDIEVGDALNKAVEHVVLISDIDYDEDGRIIRVGIMELWPPIAQYTRYGQDEQKPLSEIRRKYLDDGYVILRYKERDSVVYVHDCIVPIDNDCCAACFFTQRITLPILTRETEYLQTRTLRILSPLPKSR